MSSASKQSQSCRSWILPKNHLKLLNAGAMVLWNAMVFPYDEKPQLPKSFPRIMRRNLLGSSALSLCKGKNMTLILNTLEMQTKHQLTFDIARNSTVTEKGVKSVSVLTTCHEKDRFTVTLACLGDGSKLPLYVVFKRKTLPKNMKFPKGVLIRCQEKCWMDQGLVQDWLRTIWSKVGSWTRKKSMLVWDSF